MAGNTEIRAQRSGLNTALSFRERVRDSCSPNQNARLFSHSTLTRCQDTAEADTVSSTCFYAAVIASRRLSDLLVLFIGGGDGGYGGGYGGAGYGGGGGGSGYGGSGYGGSGYGGSGYGGGGSGYGGGGGGTGYGGGGGGYGSQSQGGGYMAGGSGGGRDNRARQDAVQPATLKQLLEATGPDDQLELNGVGLQQVTVVARLVDVVTNVTMMTMRLDDGTGTLECVHLLPADEDHNASARDAALARRQRLHEGAWVRVVGRFVVASGRRQIDAFMLRAVDNHCEIVYHRLDVVRVFLSQTKPRKPRAPAASATPVGVGGGGMRMGAGMQSGTPSLGADGLMLDPTQRAVFEYVRQRHESSKNSNEGTSVSVDDVARDVPAVGRNAQHAKQVLENLASDGHFYTTIDEDHYAFCQV
eukprot:IDg1253t1